MFQQPRKISRSRLSWIIVCLIWMAPLTLWAEDPGKAAIGKHTFRSYCATCHGEAGRGGRSRR